MEKNITDVKFTISQLDSVIVALLNNFRNNKFVSNVDKLFSNVNIDRLFDEEKKVRVFVIQKLVHLVMSKKIESKGMLLSFLDFDGRFENQADAIIEDLYQEDPSENEISLIDKKVSRSLKYNIMEDNANELSAMITDFQTEQYTDFDTFIDSFTKKFNSINDDLRNAKETPEDQRNDVNFGDNSAFNMLSKVINEKKNPASKIRTGIRALNDMFDGGFERGRLYVACGMPKGWKSGFLLNATLWCRDYTTFDNLPNGMTPCVLYLTQENTVEETIERIWSHYFGNNSRIQDFPPETANEMLHSVGLFGSEPNKAEIIIKYRSTKTVTVADIKTMISDLEKDGKKCVMLVQDYIKRLKPSVNMKDNTRLEYSMISDELAALAKELDIPVLTAMQFNREGVREVENAITLTEQLSSIEKVGSSNISESIDIIQNADYCFSLARATDAFINEASEVEIKDKYLVIKLLAGRGKEPVIKSFKHRFIDGNDMKLDEDINCPYSKSTLTKEQIINKAINDPNVKTKGPRKILN